MPNMVGTVACMLAVLRAITNSDAQKPRFSRSSRNVLCEKLLARVEDAVGCSYTAIWRFMLTESDV